MSSNFAVFQFLLFSIYIPSYDIPLMTGASFYFISTFKNKKNIINNWKQMDYGALITI